MTDPVAQHFLLMAREREKLQPTVQFLLVAHLSAGANRLGCVGQENLDGHGLSGLQFAGGDGAETAFPEVDRTSGNGIRDAGPEDNDVDGSSHEIARQRSSSLAESLLCGGRHH